MIHDTQSAQISQKQDERNIYVIIKHIAGTNEPKSAQQAKQGE